MFTLLIVLNKDYYSNNMIGGVIELTTSSGELPISSNFKVWGDEETSLARGKHRLPRYKRVAYEDVTRNHENLKRKSRLSNNSFDQKLNSLLGETKADFAVYISSAIFTYYRKVRVILLPLLKTEPRYSWVSSRVRTAEPMLTSAILSQR